MSLATNELPAQGKGRKPQEPFKRSDYTAHETTNKTHPFHVAYRVASCSFSMREVRYLALGCGPNT